MVMTADAKSALSKTIRALRERLLRDLHDETEAAYRLSIRARDAKLDEATRVRRGRLELWIAEQLRAQDGDGTKAKEKRTAEDFRRDAEKQAAYTLLNRLVILRLMEAPAPSGKPLREHAIVTGGWESQGYKHFRQLAPALVRGDETEGYGYLLNLAFEDLATELPGVFGSGSIADLIPVSAATLRHAVEQLDQPAIETCWTDDMTLGWVYQYWNDPEREALDAKLNAGGKVAPHEIASKTQMFTERYMVDWLLQNSLGPMWLAMCKKHGWTPEADGTLATLEARRAEWRAKREAGEVELTDLMPLHTEAERRWAYYVPQPIPDDAVEQAAASIRDLKILDPAVGSGHFLVVALDLLVSLYREEARQRGESTEPRWGDEAIVERILSHNLHGIDLDPRAVQIAAAALWLKAQQVSPDAKPDRLNLVASNLKLANLSDDDPALVELRVEVERETGIPSALTDMIVHALRGADQLGSLLRVDRAVENALTQHDEQLGRAIAHQGHLFDGFKERQQRVPIGKDDARSTLLLQLENFLSRHTSADDLGLRLRGEQLAVGVRFVRMLRPREYDLVVANPPYLGVRKLQIQDPLKRDSAAAAMDFYASFVVRALELCRKNRAVAFAVMRGWLFLSQFEALRAHLLRHCSKLQLADLHHGAFSAGKDVSAVLFVGTSGSDDIVGRFLQPVQPRFVVRDLHQVLRNEAGLLAQTQTFEPDMRTLQSINGSPLVYWWDREFSERVAATRPLGEREPVRQGMASSNNVRFLRQWHELPVQAVWAVRVSDAGVVPRDIAWVPYVKGAAGRCWFEPLSDVIQWRWAGLECKLLAESKYQSYTRSIKNERYFFQPGVAFTPIGQAFAARLHRYRSVIDIMGQSVYPDETAEVVCLLNSRLARETLRALNPSVHFQVGDVNRRPHFLQTSSLSIVSRLEDVFTQHEAAREASAEFRRPGPSSWRCVQHWAELAVDRPEGAPLPSYIEQLDPEAPTNQLSFAVGVALGRFGENGEGILDPATADLSHATPAGVVFLDSTLDEHAHEDRGPLRVA